MNILAAMRIPEYAKHRGIYLIAADYPGAAYVGQTKRTFSGRWADHVAMLQSGVHHNDIMQSAFRAVGFKGLHACHLQVAPPQLNGSDLVRWLFEWEGYWIARAGAANEARKR